MPGDRPPLDYSIGAIIRRNSVPREPKARWWWTGLSWRQIGAVVAFLLAARVLLEASIYEIGIWPAIAIWLVLAVGLAYIASQLRDRLPPWLKVAIDNIWNALA